MSNAAPKATQVNLRCTYEEETAIEAACEAGIAVLARVRSTAEPLPARLALRDGAPAVVFDAPEHGVSPGQACVLYDPASRERVLGGGFIAKTFGV